MKINDPGWPDSDSPFNSFQPCCGSTFIGAWTFWQLPGDLHLSSGTGNYSPSRAIWKQYIYSSLCRSPQAPQVLSSANKCEISFFFVKSRFYLLNREMSSCIGIRNKSFFFFFWTSSPWLIPSELFLDWQCTPAEQWTSVWDDFQNQCYILCTFKY